MNTLRSLRLWLPILLLVLAGVGGLFLFFFEARVSRIQFEQSFQQDQNLRTSRFQAEIERWVNRGDMEMVQSVMAEMAAFPELQNAVFLNASNVVLAATRREYIRFSFQVSTFATDSRDQEHITAAMESARRSRRSSSVFTSDHDELVVCYPTSVPLEGGELEAPRTGLVLVRYDLRLAEAANLRRLQREFGMEFAGILFIALVLGAGVHFLITLRLEKLQQIIAEFAAGKSVARAPSRLGDEISYLINCFNEMASAISKEISERKQAEDQLRKSGAEVQDLYDNAPCGYHSLDANGLFVRINNTECDWLGYRSEELLGKRKFIDLLTSESLEKFLREFPKFKERGSIHDLTFDIVRKDGTILPVAVNATAIKDKDGKFLMSRSVVHDITERKRADETLRRLNRELRAISKCNLVLMRVADEQTLLAEVCRIICKEAGYHMAWVGYVENDADKLVRPVACAGEEKGYLEKTVITWSETESGCGPTGVAIRTGETVCVQDFASEAHALPWRDQALQRGYRSSIALPLKDEASRIFGVINIYSTELKAFTPAEVRLLEELAADLAYGISSLRVRLERKRMDEALRSSEEKYRTLIEKLQAAVVVHAADTRIVTCNPVAELLLGLSRDQLLGRTTIDPSWHLMREDGKRMSVDEYPVSRVIATRQPVRNMIAGIHRPEAQDVWAMVNASPVFDGGEISQVIVTFIDVTERRQTEAKLAHLAAIVESSEDAIIGKSLDERIVSWNDGAERMYGYRAEEIIGKSVTVLVPPDKMDEFETIMKGLGRGVGVEHVETIRVCKDGRMIPVALTVSPIRDAAGRITGASTIARDITNQKRAEEEIRKLNTELEQRVNDRTAALQLKSDELKKNQAVLMNIIEDLNEKTVALEAVNKELEAFSYSVSHDLRGPLRSIDGFSRALLEDYSDKLDSEGKEDLKTVRAASQRMGQIIDDMLRLAQLNRSEMRITTVDLSELVRQLVEDLKRSDPERKVKFIIAPDCVVNGDASLLRIAMENILGNAWKYTGKKPDAKIEFGKREYDKVQVFFVRDNGCGFDMNFAHKLFGAFQRLHTADEFPGTGIGLASVQRVIRRHGGKVWIEGAVGKGTTIYFTVPQAERN